MNSDDKAAGAVSEGQAWEPKQGMIFASYEEAEDRIFEWMGRGHRYQTGEGSLQEWKMGKITQVL